jgi:hypothetical protein
VREIAIRCTQTGTKPMLADFRPPAWTTMPRPLGSSS